MKQHRDSGAGKFKDRAKPAAAADHAASVIGSDEGAVSRPRESDRREHRRLKIRLPVECRVVGDGPTRVIRTITRNISTGGIYMEQDAPDFTTGDRLDVELTLPPAEGVSPYQGRASCRAEVIRVQDRGAGIGARYGIAARFLDRLRMSF